MCNETNHWQYCFNRLPCGLCRLTDKMCPIQSNSDRITYASCAESSFGYSVHTTNETEKKDGN